MLYKLLIYIIYINYSQKSGKIRNDKVRERKKWVGILPSGSIFYSIRTNENQPHLYVKRTVLVLTGQAGAKGGVGGNKKKLYYEDVEENLL